MRVAVTVVHLKDTSIEKLKMKVDYVYFYSDSNTIINYTRNDYSKFGVFAAHRIHEIRNSFEPKQWHYEPLKLNGAGDARGSINVQNK